AQIKSNTKLKDLKRGHILSGNLQRNQVRFHIDIQTHDYSTIQLTSFAQNCKLETAHGLEIFSTMINKGDSYPLNSIKYNDYTKVMRIRASNVFTFQGDLSFVCENGLNLNSTVSDFEESFGKVITIE